MSDPTGSAAPGTVPPNHLGTSVPSGDFERGAGHGDGPAIGDDKAEMHDEKKQPMADDEDEDADMDALIEELESQDEGVDEEEEETEVGGARPVPEELLQTDTRVGLTDQEVLTRRKKYGLNQMKEEKENMILKFLGFFVGPIQFVMEVCLLSGYVS